MKIQLRKTALSLAIAACVGVSGAAVANTTASGVKGQIVGPNGNPATGTEVTIIHVPSGSSKVTYVNDAGYFSASGLRVGGPYDIIVDSDKYEDQLVENIFLTLGSDYPVSVQLKPASNIEQIVVTGRPISAMSGGTGPSSTFTLEDLENAPAINRDLRDIVRADPRVYVDESRGAIQCGGNNPRYNSLTVDGIRMNDNFGLSSNGYPTIGAPFSFDSIDQVAVELAPFDVQYGGFTACNINAVTKSGTNELHGGVFFDFTSDSYKGDKVEGVKADNGNYTDKRYGFNLGLPLIKDQLFFFGTYEKQEGIAQFNYGAAQGDDPSVTAGDIANIQRIAQEKYNYNAGTMPGSMPVEDEKILVKLDWTINDNHRANFIYNYNDAFTISQSDTGSSRLSLDSHYYEQGAKFTSFVSSLYSDWNDDFSTELRFGKSEVDARVQSLDAASGFGEFQVKTAGGATVYIGPDDSRHSNKLKYDTTTFKLAGKYYLDKHTISAGYEYEKLNVFNMFVQHTQGEFRFNSIEDFENGLASRIEYNNAAGTNNPADAAAEFSYKQHTLYLQDEYNFDNIDASLTFGLRYDRYDSSDVPNFNENFTNRYGFSNQQNLDGMDLIQPRVGFNWYATDALEVRAGVGLYTGGNPNVWVSNAYSNDGVTNIYTRRNNVDLFNTAMTNFDGGTPGYDVPQEMFDEVANTNIRLGDSIANVIDPNFKMPSEWKYALGATFTTDNDYVISADALYSRKNDAAVLTDLGVAQNGYEPVDGRPIYTAPEGRNGEFMLTNADNGGDALVLSTALSKRYENGLDFTLAYSYTDAKDINPMTSSVADSNYHNLATVNPNNPGIATSDYEVPHRFTLKLGYAHEFFDGYATRFNLFGQASKGMPYSYTFADSDNLWSPSFADKNRQLLYVPQVNDPNVVYGDDFDIDAFNAFVNDENLKRGSITGRNSEYAPWFIKFDFKVTQELPGFMEGHKGEAYFVIDNLTNLLNDDWGKLEKGNFVGNPVVKTSRDDQGRYVYESFNSGNVGTYVQRDASLWEMRIGVRYTF